MNSIGIIGCGHWGQNYLRVFREISEDIAISVCDADKTRLHYLRQKYPSIKIFTGAKDLIRDKGIKAVVISSPASTHFEFAKEAVSKGKHVLVEKPLTLITREAEELVELAEKKRKVLMVSHTFLYNPAIEQVKKYIGSGKCGKVYYLQATRTHLGLIRKDVNVFWDLAPHDISIFNFLLGSSPLMVSATGSRLLNNPREDVGFVTLIYPDNIIGNIHVSWIDSNKERKISIVASKERIIFDDLNNLEKIRIYEKGIEVERQISNFGEFQLLLRDGDIISPKIEAYEPLKRECEHFLDCIKQKKNPLTDGKNGLEVVRVLESLQESLRQNGNSVKIRP